MLCQDVSELSKGVAANYLNNGLPEFIQRATLNISGVSCENMSALQLPALRHQYRHCVADKIGATGRGYCFEREYLAPTGVNVEVSIEENVPVEVVQVCVCLSLMVDDVWHLLPHNIVLPLRFDSL